VIALSPKAQYRLLFMVKAIFMDYHNHIPLMGNCQCLGLVGPMLYNHGPCFRIAQEVIGPSIEGSAIRSRRLSHDLLTN